MKILAIDTHSELSTIVLSDDSKVIAFQVLSEPRKHINFIHSSIGSLLSKARLDISDIDLFSVVKGPGSFTGIRIGVTLIKGLSLALNKPVVSLISLDLLAYGIKDKAVGKNIAVLIDAKRNSFYCAFYRLDSDNLVRIGDYGVLKIDDIMNKLNDGYAIVGEGLGVFQNKSNVSALECRLIPEIIADLSFVQWAKRGEENIFDLKPFYLYPKECTVTNAQMITDKKRR